MEPGTLCFECNICGKHCLVAAAELQREIASCKACGSTPRARAIIRALSLELFGQNLVLPDFPVSRGISGLGMTDWEGYAVRLAEKVHVHKYLLSQGAEARYLQLRSSRKPRSVK